MGFLSFQLKKQSNERIRGNANLKQYGHNLEIWNIHDSEDYILTPDEHGEITLKVL